MRRTGLLSHKKAQKSQMKERFSVVHQFEIFDEYAEGVR
jgi:hypothetical protein